MRERSVEIWYKRSHDVDKRPIVAKKNSAPRNQDRAKAVSLMTSLHRNGRTEAIAWHRNADSMSRHPYLNKPSCTACHHIRSAMEVRHVITQTDVDSLQYTDQIQQSEAESTSGISEEEPIVGTQGEPPDQSLSVRSFSSKPYQ